MKQIARNHPCSFLCSLSRNSLINHLSENSKRALVLDHQPIPSQYSISLPAEKNLNGNIGRQWVEKSSLDKMEYQLK